MHEVEPVRIYDHRRGLQRVKVPLLSKDSVASAIAAGNIKCSECFHGAKNATYQDEQGGAVEHDTEFADIGRESFGADTTNMESGDHGKERQFDSTLEHQRNADKSSPSPHNLSSVTL